MIVQQTTVFCKQKKKLHANQKKQLDAAMRTIMQQPSIGQQKKGDLSFVRVYKFKMISQECLLAYQYHAPDTIILLALGSHENFYRDLKRSVR